MHVQVPDESTKVMGILCDQNAVLFDASPQNGMIEFAAPPDIERMKGVETGVIETPCERRGEAFVDEEPHAELRLPRSSARSTDKRIGACIRERRFDGVARQVGIVLQDILYSVTVADSTMNGVYRNSGALNDRRSAHDFRIQLDPTIAGTCVPCHALADRRQQFARTDFDAWRKVPFGRQKASGWSLLEAGPKPLLVLFRKV